MDTNEDLDYVAWMDATHDDAAASEAEFRQGMSDWMESLCEGHESLRGEDMGREVFCNGTCRPAAERTESAYVEYLEGFLPDD
jgi:hypothetical protein